MGGCQLSAASAGVTATCSWDQAPDARVEAATEDVGGGDRPDAIVDLLQADELLFEGPADEQLRVLEAECALGGGRRPRPAYHADDMRPRHEALLDAWRINDRVTTFLVERIPPELWGAALPRMPRRAVRNICAHLHNSRCSWMKGLAAGTGIATPARVAPATATPRTVSSALGRSGLQMLHMIEAGLRSGGEFPQVSSPFVWGAWPRNVLLFVAYAVSHEAHHRGQILLVARELGQRLPPEVAGGLWQWSSRLKESRAEKPAGA